MWFACYLRVSGACRLDTLQKEGRVEKVMSLISFNDRLLGLIWVETGCLLLILGDAGNQLSG